MISRNKHTSQHGFTIIELLIVIVVIGILAAITLVAYNGVQSKASSAVLQSDLRNAATQLEINKGSSGNDQYPGDDSALKPSQGTTFQYTSDGQSYCLSATNSRASSSYHISSTDQAVEQGVCDGDSETPSQVAVNQGNVTTIAGTGTAGWQDGASLSAQFNRPSGITSDTAGNLYISEYGGNRIRKIATDGTVSTIAGSGTAGSANGTGTAAQFNTPYGIAIDGANNLYISDYTNNQVRKITPTGVVSSFASIASPIGLAFDSHGNLFVASFIGSAIYKITPSGTTSVFAGTVSSSGSINGTGTAAKFFAPTGIAIDSSDNIYVADSNNLTIRKITPSAVVTTVAGITGTNGSTNGPVASATFYYPASLALSPDGTLFISSNNIIRKLTSDMTTVSTLAGATTTGTANGQGTTARFNSPILYVDSHGVIYVADFNNNLIRKVE